VLAALGYTNVREFREGKKGWRAAGLPMERAGQIESRTPAAGGSAGT
jgi:3-mercaptopyruvate sulfurtransferase SseA